MSESSWTYSVYFVQCPRFKWFWGKPTILTSSIPNNKSSLTTNTTKKCYMEWSMAAQEKGDRQNSISKLFCPLAPSCAATVHSDTEVNGEKMSDRRNSDPQSRYDHDTTPRTNYTEFYITYHFDTITYCTNVFNHRQQYM